MHKKCNAGHWCCLDEHNELTKFLYAVQHQDLYGYVPKWCGSLDCLALPNNWIGGR